MKLLVDIEEKLFQKVHRLTRARTKKEAIVIPMQAYLETREREELAALIGHFDMPMTLAKLKQMRHQWKKS